MKNALKIGLLCICFFVLNIQIFILINSGGNEEPTVGGNLKTPEQSGIILERMTKSENITETVEPDKIDVTENNVPMASVNFEDPTEDPEPPDETETPEETTDIADIEEPEETNVFAEPASKNAPVFMYHTSSENNPGGLTDLYVKPSEFEKQVQYLIENGFTFCTFDDYDNLNNIKKPVFITFDDGYKENYTEIFPILQQYNAKITIFLTLSNIPAENFTVEMIQEMSDSGLVKFESHTLNHADLSEISSNNAKITSELADSKAQIEEITGKTVVALAYPHGKFNDAVKEKTEEFYLFGLSIVVGTHNTDDDLYEIRRIRVNRSTSIEAFVKSMGG